MRDHNEFFYFYIRLFFVLGLALFAAWLSSSHSRDSQQYIQYYDSIIAGDYVFVEPTFRWLANFSYSFLGGHFALFFLYALISVSLKLYLIRRNSKFLFLSCVVYFSYFFLVQDSNQIRIGLASAFFLASFFFYIDRKYLFFLAAGVAASLAHYSCIVFLLIPFCLVRSQRLGISVSVSYVVLSVFFVIFWGFSGVGDFFLEWASQYDPTGKMSAYVEMKKEGQFSSVNYLNRFLPISLFLIPLLFFYYRACSIDKNFSYFCQMVCFGVFLFCFLSPLPVLAYRISDIFLGCCIFLFPFVCTAFRSVFLGGVLIFIYFLVNFYYFFLLLIILGLGLGLVYEDFS